MQLFFSCLLTQFPIVLLCQCGFPAPLSYRMFCNSLRVTLLARYLSYRMFCNSLRVTLWRGICLVRVVINICSYAIQSCYQQLLLCNHPRYPASVVLFGNPIFPTISTMFVNYIHMEYLIWYDIFNTVDLF